MNFKPKTEYANIAAGGSENLHHIGENILPHPELKDVTRYGFDGTLHY
jgi:hypothetical protein